ncbi:MAG: hypothetical protein K2O18_06925 [Oscillospiraceae bacterium]|nr:hypothetical protein [Oscillospiraceae bacterium]
MAVNYNLNALEILKILGGTPSPDYVPDPQIPAMLNSFLSMAKNNPLFATPDIHVDRETWFSYDSIQERIDEDAEYWREHPEECEDDEYYSFSQLPRDRWHEKTANYLYIGSDYAAGVVVWGIREEDLNKEDPPVYMLHEMDEPAGWKVFSETLSGFLMYILCGSTLGCEFYDTAKNVLEKQGWRYEACEKPADVSKEYSFVFGMTVCGGWDAENNVLLVSQTDGTCRTYRISRTA